MIGIGETGRQPSMKMTEQSVSNLSNVECSAARGAVADESRSAALETLDVLEAVADGLVYFDKHDRLVI